MISVLYVCIGNICRSPALEAILRHLVKERNLQDQVFAASCGLINAHVGSPCDARMFQAAQIKGIHIEGKAQVFCKSFLDAYDYVFAATDEIREELLLQAKPEQVRKIFLATAFSLRYKNLDIPDPYYLGSEGFNEVMEIGLDSCRSFLDFLALESKND